MTTRKKRRAAALQILRQTADAFLEHESYVSITDKGYRKAIEILEAMPDAELAALATGGNLVAQKVLDARTHH